MVTNRNGTSSSRDEHADHGKSTKQAAKPRSKRKQELTPLRVGTNFCDFSLLEEEELAVHVVDNVPPVFTRSHFDSAAVAERFRVAFRSVWMRLPSVDRQQLLTYWHDLPSYLTRRSGDKEPPPRPFIQIVRRLAPPEVEITRFGTELIFPASLVLDEPDRLVEEIARALAVVYHMMYGKDVTLINKVIEEPLELWLQQEGAEEYDDNYERKRDALEEEYLPLYRARIAEIMKSWGFEVADGTAEGQPKR